MDPSIPLGGHGGGGHGGGGRDGGGRGREEERGRGGSFGCGFARGFNGRVNFKDVSTHRWQLHRVLSVRISMHFPIARVRLLLTYMMTILLT